ncbi:MAG: RNA methyltransferase [Deltaproteobacteria bacterium]|nr:RNA methyltransferase [Deltaproteobacteria bacterium]
MARRIRIPSRRDPLRRAFESVDAEAVIAVLEPLCTDERRERLLEVVRGRLASVTVVMDAPHDPHNGAAVMRSCDAFGVQELHIVERTEAFAADTAVAKGTESWVDVHHHATAASALRGVDGFTLVATHPEGELTPLDLGRLPRVALVMGNEHDGICAELRVACHASVRIPMRGFVESLNVSVSAATLLAYATGGRPGDMPEPRRRTLYARWLALTVPRSLDILDARGIEVSLEGS